MLPPKNFENLYAIYIMKLQLQCFFRNFLTSFFLKIFAILWGPYNCLPPSRTGRSNFGDALLRHCPSRFKKHAENTTIFLQCLNRLNEKEAAVLGKQVLLFDEKKI